MIFLLHLHTVIYFSLVMTITVKEKKLVHITIMFYGARMDTFVVLWHCTMDSFTVEAYIVPYIVQHGCSDQLEYIILAPILLDSSTMCISDYSHSNKSYHLLQICLISTENRVINI